MCYAALSYGVISNKLLFNLPVITILSVTCITCCYFHQYSQTFEITNGSYIYIYVYFIYIYMFIHSALAGKPDSKEL